jgi:anti-anti-sigma factor
MSESTQIREDTDPNCRLDAGYGARAAVFIEVEQEQGPCAPYCVLRIRGRFATGADLDYLSSKLDQIRRLRAARILADFTELISIGSTGISFVISLYRMVAQESGGRLVLAGANALVRETLKLTGLSKFIPLAEDVDSGLARLLAN